MRPYIKVHMLASIDGKVTGPFLESTEALQSSEIYYAIHRSEQADAFACGRVTMNGSFTRNYYPDLSLCRKYLTREDYISEKARKPYAVSFDRKGRLGWQDCFLHDEDPGYNMHHVIEVLCEDLVDERYLSYLREKKISYIFAGKKELNLSLALEKLTSLFGIQHLLLEGGAIINEAFLQEDLVDAISLVIAPIAAGEGSSPLFCEGTITPFSLEDVQTEGNTVILNYKR